MLKVFSDGGYDWYVAETVESARAMQTEMAGENPGEDDQWFECDPEQTMRIWWADDHASNPNDDGAAQLLDLTFRSWAELAGPGFLCTSEF